MSLRIVKARITDSSATKLAEEIYSTVEGFNIPITISQKPRILDFAGSINVFMSNLGQDERDDLAAEGIYVVPGSKEIDTDSIRASLLNTGFSNEPNIFLFDDLVRLRFQKQKYDYFCTRELIGQVGMTLTETNYPDANEGVNRFKIAHLLGHFLSAVSDVSNHRDPEEDDLIDDLIASEIEAETYEGHSMPRHCANNCIMSRSWVTLLSNKDIDCLNDDVGFCKDCLYAMSIIYK